MVFFFFFFVVVLIIVIITVRSRNVLRLLHAAGVSVDGADRVRVERALQGVQAAPSLDEDPVLLLLRPHHLLLQRHAPQSAGAA